MNINNQKRIETFILHKKKITQNFKNYITQSQLIIFYFFEQFIVDASFEFFVVACFITKIFSYTDEAEQIMAVCLYCVFSSPYVINKSVIDSYQ